MAEAGGPGVFLQQLLLEAPFFGGRRSHGVKKGRGG